MDISYRICFVYPPFSFEEDTKPFPAHHLLLSLSLSLSICSFMSPLQILHHHIASVEKLSLTTTGCPLVIQCRNFRVVHFVVQRERDCHDVYSSLLRLLQPGGFPSV